MLKRFFLSERAMLTAIVVNAVIIFALYFPQFKQSHPWLEVFDQLFILLFLIEAIVKLYVYKPRAYFQAFWNRFDFVIVLGSLPALLVHYIDIPNTSLLIILRLFRLVRIVRFIRFVPHLNQVLGGLARALRASVFVLAALVFLNLMIAIFTCHFFAELDPDHFGDPLSAAYSIFTLFTLEGWYEIPARITKSVEHPVLIGLIRLYFIAVVLIGGIFGMSLANAVFVDEMTMDNNQAVESKIDDLKAEVAELKHLLQEVGVQLEKQGQPTEDT